PRPRAPGGRGETRATGRPGPGPPSRTAATPDATSLPPIRPAFGPIDHRSHFTSSTLAPPQRAAITFPEAPARRPRADRPTVRTRGHPAPRPTAGKAGRGTGVGG